MKSRLQKGEADDANREMWRLVRDNDWEAIRQRLAAHEWDPNRPLVMALSPGGFLLLSAAIGQGQIAVVRQLIELGANVNARMPGEDWPLMDACESGNHEMVLLLLQGGAKVNVKSAAGDDGDAGETPLMEVATGGHRGIAETLLKNGARIDATTRRGRSALSLVLDAGDIDLDMVQFLLDAGCPVDGRDLSYPILKRHLDLFKLLLARQRDVSQPFDWPASWGTPQKGDTPLFVAVEPTNEETFGFARPQPATKRAHRLAIIDLLIEAGADVNAQRGSKPAGWTPLILAVAQDDDEIARRLIAAGADPKKEVETSRCVTIDEQQKFQTGPLSALALAEERPTNKKTRTLLLGHE